MAKEHENPPARTGTNMELLFCQGRRVMATLADCAIDFTAESAAFASGT